MKTTQKIDNHLKATQLIAIREEIKELEKKEKELKEYFSALIGDDSQLTVSRKTGGHTTVIFSKHETTRMDFDAKKLSKYFAAMEISEKQFRRSTSYSWLKVKAIS
jgi:hypothetical protein